MLSLHHVAAASIICGLFLGIMLALIAFFISFRVAVEYVDGLEGPGRV
jgi:hypothetical protein